MKKGNLLFTVLLLSMLFFQQIAVAQYTVPEKMNWWYESRFGMFIHFGSYSYNAKGEWAFTNDKWTKADYQTQVSANFNPVNFNGGTIARLAKNAGMKYVVITAKHHEGFAMWQTAVQSFKDVTGTKLYDLPDFTVFKTRDILKELKDSCEAQGLKFCVYYSILDWNHSSQYSSPLTTMISMDARTNYIKDMKAQLTELITKYHPASIWFDGDWFYNSGTPTLSSWWTKADGVDLYNYLVGLDPNLIVNERVCRGFGLGDYLCPENTVPAQPESRAWETCQTMNNSWGYTATDNNWKSSSSLIQQLVQVASRDGNMLLNIGPMGDGTVPAPSVTILQDFATWMGKYSESIYGTTRSPYSVAGEPTWGYYTKKTNKLYAHVFNWPPSHVLEIPSLTNTINKIYLLSDTTKVLSYTVGTGTVKITLPATAPDLINSVVVVNVSGLPFAQGSLDAFAAIKSKVDSTLTHAIVGTTTGTHLQTSIDTLTLAFNKAKLLDISISTQLQIDQMTSDLTTALKVYNSALYVANTLKDGDYIIKIHGTNLCWTNTGIYASNLTYTEEKPVFQSPIAGDNDQLFHLTLLSNGRYELDSKSSIPGYINESAKIRRVMSSFYADWNSLNILYNGTAYAVQCAGSAASQGLWILVANVVK